MTKLPPAVQIYGGVALLVAAGVLVNQGWLGTDVLDDIRTLVMGGAFGFGGYVLGKRAGEPKA